MTSRRRSGNGNAILEFTLTSIPLMFLLISLVQMCLGMWNYHTLAETIKLACRTAAVRGTDCAGLGCAMTVGDIAKLIVAKGTGLMPGSLNVTLTSASGNINCDPITSCYTSATTWPPSGGNTVTSVISITGSYTFNSALSMVAPGGGTVPFRPVTFYAVSQQPITF